MIRYRSKNVIAPPTHDQNCTVLHQNQLLFTRPEKKMWINLDQKKYRNDQNVEHYRF